MKITTVLADDEPVARAGLRAMLAAFDWVTIIGEAADGVRAIELIERHRPELVFLDIQMPGLVGTEVLRRLTWRPYVVFTTAWSEHAVQAFELGALDYLLKPFGPSRLHAAMQRVQSAIGEPAPVDAVERLSGALGSGPISRLFVRVGGQVVPVPLDQVQRFEADGDYVIVYTHEARHLLHLSLARLEERLDPNVFVRVHRAHLVQLGSVRAFKPDLRGNLEAIMQDGVRVPVSRSRAQEIRRLAR